MLKCYRNTPAVKWTALLLTCLLLAGCSGPQTSGPPQIRILLNAVEGGKNSRSVAWLKAMEPKVEAALPVDLVILGDGVDDESYKTKIVLDLYGGTGPDLISMDSFWVAGMASAGLMLPLDPYLATFPDWKYMMGSTTCTWCP